MNCVKNLAKCQNGTEPPYLLLRRYYFEKNLDRKPKICIIDNTLLNKYHKQCNVKCLIECQLTYYTFLLYSRHKSRNVTKKLDFWTFFHVLLKIIIKFQPFNFVCISLIIFRDNIK